MIEELQQLFHELTPFHLLLSILLFFGLLAYSMIKILK